VLIVAPERGREVVPFGFDQTNGKASGLDGDDGGALPGAATQPTVKDFVGSVLRSHEMDPATPEDSAVTPYSEEGH
jgi:hypothetical protein